MSAEQHLPHLSPADAAATFRSLPRRFRAELAPLTPDDPVLRRAMVPDGSGWSAADHLRHAVRDLAMLDHAVEEVMVHDRPTLHPATLHDADREWVPDELDVEAQLDELEDVCETFADRVAAAPAEAWVRTATVGQDTVDATRLLRHAVGSALDHLTGVREALAEAR